ncbi:MMPL family transporter [Demequina sp. B12]|uniref:MMPL family transporter n=1 Tax=Demequina sp. B12 TaxID=2992757 RepID=UPI00237BCE34|nr:MMPL family transporter [Demequina sp. B12]MDE0573568.1 MMPL family transporter [Demequina sp. B12]
MANFLFRLGRGSARKPFIAIVAWIVALAASVGAFLAFGGTLTDSFSIPGTETQKVTDQLSQELEGLDGATARIVYQSQDDVELTSDQQQQISESLATVAEFESVSAVIDPFATTAQLEEQAAQLAAGAEQIETGRAELDAGQEQLDAAAAEAQAGQEQLDAGQEQLDAAIAQAQEAGQYEAAKAQFDAQQAELDTQQEQLTAGLEELASQQAQIDAGYEELAASEEQLALGQQLADNAATVRAVSEDGTTALGAVTFVDDMLTLPQSDKDEVMESIEAAPLDGVDVYFSSEIATAVDGILGVGEVIGVFMALVVLFVMMRVVWPAVTPIITSVIGVGVGVTASLSLSGTLDMSSVTPVLGVMLALAVGIDYALFIINRHRTNLKRGMEVTESIGLANGTAGNAVVFAGSTVLIALLALNVTGIPFIGVMGNVAAFCIFIAVLVAITLVPAVLGLIGTKAISRRSRDKIGQPMEPEAPYTPIKTGQAWLQVVAGVVILGIIAIPAASMRLGLPGGDQELPDSTQYQAYTIIDEKFGEGLNGTLIVTADLAEAVTEEQVLATQVELENVLMENDTVAAVAPAGVSEDMDFMAFQVIPTEGPNAESTEELVHAIRDLSPLEDGTELGVAGTASGNIDISQKLADALPVYLAVVVGLSLIILIVVFRSILVPVMATLGFVLSLFAAFGAVTAVYQWGWLSDIFGIHAPGPILSFLPIMLTGILFGLAMDYQLFITSGMREAYVHGANARESVVAGMRHGRAVVAAAAIIMASVFGGFIFSHITMIQPMGFGLAIGVLFDAFVVRMLIIPSLMHIVGEGAWWMPKWLDKILPNVDVEGSALEREHPLPVAAAPAADSDTTAPAADTTDTGDSTK